MKNNIISLKPFIDRMEEEERNRQAYLAEREELRQVEFEQAESWRRERGIHGFPGEDDVPVDDGYRFFDPDDPEHIMSAFDALIEQQKAEHVEAVEALGVIKDFLGRFSPTSEEAAEPDLEIRDPHPEEPLSVFEALCLPELGGQLYVGTDVPGRPGPNVREKTIRSAWDRGDLMFMMLGKNKFTTRTMIKEWLTACREKSINPASLKESPATTRTASSRTKAPGSSSTQENKLRQDALSLRLKNLR